MATGASTCDLAIILIDARYGVQTQTKRHSFIVSLLGIKHVIVAVNKMDLLDYSQAVFEKIHADYLAFAESLNVPDIRFVPMSALKGDNVVNRSEAMPWFDGPPLMELLNTIEISGDQSTVGLRFPVQFVNRPNLDFRGFAGTLAAGTVRKGEAVMAMPSKKTSRIKAVYTPDGEAEAASAPQAITVTLEDEIDISRGDMLVRPDELPAVDPRFIAHVVWMAEAPLTPGRQYTIKHTTKSVSGSVARILHRIDVNTLHHHPAQQLKLNEIGLCELAVSAALAFDPYEVCKGTGSFIVIDKMSNVTVGAGMIVGVAERGGEWRQVTPQERAARFDQKPVTLWITGAAAETAAIGLERRLFDRGYACTLLDSDFLGAQTGLVAENINLAGMICICPATAAATPKEDAVNIVLPADGIDIDKVIGLLKPLHYDLEGPEDFVI
jgi:bifunctional enzyme CysN/CysC